MRQTLNSSPLTLEEQQWVQQVADRLQAEFQTLLETLPQRLHQPYNLAREYGLDKSICQRIIAGVRVEKSPSRKEVIEKMPGVEGLRGFVRTIWERSSKAESSAAAMAAVDEFQELIRQIGGSHARLKARLNAEFVETLDEISEIESLEARKSMFDAAAKVAGCFVDVQANCILSRNVPGTLTLNENAGYIGAIGYRARPGSLPLTRSIWQSDDKRASSLSSSLSPDFLDSPDDQGSLLPQFCTQPLPSVISRTAGNIAVEMITPSASDGPIDVVIARRSAPIDHPSERKDKHLLRFVRIKTPAKRLIFDVYMHRSLVSAAAFPTIGSYMWHPNITSNFSQAWQEKIPGEPRLELLGPGTSKARTDAWHRHGEVTQYVFDRLRWPAGEFVGFRSDIAYPVWGAFYVMCFDFRDGDDRVS